MSITAFTGNTTRIQATFNGFTAVGATPGPPVDPDSNAVTITVYNADETVSLTDVGVRDSTGVYHYDYVAPTSEGIYFVEFKGLFSGKPQLSRQRVIVKFKPAT